MYNLLVIVNDDQDQFKKIWGPKIEALYFELNKPIISNEFPIKLIQLQFNLYSVNFT